MSKPFPTRLAVRAALLLGGVYCAGGTLRAQAFEPLRSAGELSTDFTRAAAEHYRTKADANRDFRGQERARRDRFALETSVFLNRLHRSGQVLTGDWVSALVQRVGAEVLAVAPDVPADVRFYVLPSAEVNAFATPDHIVYVTMGLLARIDNEAQLAFILAHELGHIARGHGLELYLEGERLVEESSGGGLFTRADPERGFLARQQYSRELETAADAYAHAMFARTGYGGAATLGVFDVLELAFLPFAPYPFSAADLTAESGPLREDWILAEVSAIEPQDVDEDESTHPDTRARRALAVEKLGSVEGVAARVWSAAELTALRRQARYEVTDYRLRDFEHPEAINDALWLLAHDPEPDAAYLRRVIVQAGLNQIALRSQYEAFRARLAEGNSYDRRRLEDLDPWPGYGATQGEMQRLYHLFAQAPVSALAAHWLELALALERDYPDLASARALTDRLMVELQGTDDFDADYWLARRPTLVAALDGHALAERFRESESYADLAAWNREDGTRLAQQARRGVALGDRAVTVVAPRYRYGKFGLAGFDERPLDTEVGERRQLDQIAAAMHATGVRGAVLSDQLGAGSVDALNDLRVAKDWTNQFVRLEALRLLPYNHDRMLALTARQGTPHVVMFSEYVTRIGGVTRGFGMYLDLLVYSIVNPFDALASVASPRVHRARMQWVVDPAARTIVHSQPVDASDRQNGVSQRALYYDFFHQIAETPAR